MGSSNHFARIVITRAAAYRPMSDRNCVVILDGARLGRLRPGEALDHIVDSGQHRLQARIGWLVRSRLLGVDVSAGNEVRLTIVPRGIAGLVLQRELTQAAGPIAPDAPPGIGRGPEMQ